jgi:hypothetical protein
MSLAQPAERVRGSGADTRARLVAALNTVPGLAATSEVPDVATPGAAWPRWRQTLWNGPLCDPAQHAYDVYVVLPAAYLATTVDEGDSFRDLVAPVLRRVGRIDYAEPTALTFNDNQTMPGIRFRVTID